MLWATLKTIRLGRKNESRNWRLKSDRGKEKGGGLPAVWAAGEKLASFEKEEPSCATKKGSGGKDEEGEKARRRGRELRRETGIVNREKKYRGCSEFCSSQKKIAPRVLVA